MNIILDGASNSPPCSIFLGGGLNSQSAIFEFWPQHILEGWNVYNSYTRTVLTYRLQISTVQHQVALSIFKKMWWYLKLFWQLKLGKLTAFVSLPKMGLISTPHIATEPPLVNIFPAGDNQSCDWAFIASGKGELDCLRYLADNGADLSIPLNDGTTPRNLIKVGKKL